MQRPGGPFVLGDSGTTRPAVIACVRSGETPPHRSEVPGTSFSSSVGNALIASPSVLLNAAACQKARSTTPKGITSLYRAFEIQGKKAFEDGVVGEVVGPAVGVEFLHPTHMCLANWLYEILRYNLYSPAMPRGAAFSVAQIHRPIASSCAWISSSGISCSSA